VDTSVAAKKAKRRGWKKTDRKERRRRRRNEEARVLRDNYACLYRVTWYHRNVLIINSIKNLKYNRENVRHSIFPNSNENFCQHKTDILLVKLI